MFLPFPVGNSTNGLGGMVSLVTGGIWARHSTNNGSITISELSSQWANPSDISTILMIIGGDVVQSALAQSTGKWFTPVCFSFGWVSYAFVALLHVIGDGRLLPEPDYPVTVLNLKSGYARSNRNWTIGRILRDGEAWIERRKPLEDKGIRITVFEAQQRKTGTDPTKFAYDKSHLFGLGVMVIQLVVASIPVILRREWGVLFITAVGTMLAQIAGSLPQWRAEKLPNRQHSNDIYALTTGNGSKDILVIIGRGQCLNLEELSVSDTPRNGKPWEKFKKLSEPRRHPDGKPKLHRSGTELRKSREALGLPYGFWVTRVVCIVLSILWLLLLINVAAIKDSTWYLLLVGAIGMFQNGILAAMEKSPSTRNIPLRHADTITCKKVMDGLMDFDVTYKCGRPLLAAFFPGSLRPSEKDWWEGKHNAYDEERKQESRERGVPRSFLPSIETESNSSEGSEDSEKIEMSISNPFLDPDTMKISDSSRSSPEKPSNPFNISWQSRTQPPPTKNELLAPRSNRLASPIRSSLRRQVAFNNTADDESQETPPPEAKTSQSHKPPKSALSVEEVREGARSPDWA